MESFRGKRTIVTGGGSGIGRALALALAAEGADVVVTDIVQERIDEVVAELQKQGARAGGYRVDHADLEATRAFSERYAAEWGPVDVLCCNAGIGHGARIETTSLEEWERVLGVNLWGVIYMIHLFVPGMVDRRQGAILITASGAGLAPLPGMAPYNVTKAAMVSLAETLRMELAAHNIGVSALCPGVINTNIVRDGDIHFDDAGEKGTKGEIVKFYATRGTDPAIVARDALRALKRDIGIMPTPAHVWPLYLLHRIAPGLYQRIGGAQWRKGKSFILRVQ